MTISSETARKAGPYNCNGALVTFAFSFKIFTASTDLNVVLATSAGVETALVYSTHYTVSMNADQDTNPGGTITTVLTYATGNTITIGSAVQATQTTDIPNQSSFHATVVEQGLDKVTALQLDNKEKLARSIRGPISDEDPFVELPTAANRALKYLSFDSSGQPAASGGGPGSVPISSAMEPVVAAATLALARTEMGVPSESTLASSIAGGRLTLNSFAPPTQMYKFTPGTGATVYYVPYSGDVLGVYNTSTLVWELVKITAASAFSVASLTDDRPFDVFGYNNAGVVALEGVSWTNDTTRATDLEAEGTTLTKAGDHSRRYLGTGRKRGGTIWMNTPRLELWNMYNREPIHVYVREVTDTWTYASATWRQVRAAAANQIDFCIGLANGTTIDAAAYGRAFNGTATARFVAVGVGLNSIVTNNLGTVNLGASCTSTVEARPASLTKGSTVSIPQGQNYLAWLERGDGTDTQTFHGDNGLTSNDLATGLVATILM